MTTGQDHTQENGQDHAQRIDKWLWCSRFFKTRSLASAFVSKGNVRVTRHDQVMRIEKPAFCIRPGDELVFMTGARLRVIRVLFCASRRGPAPEAQSLYEDKSPIEDKPPSTSHTVRELAGTREKGTGRPTKKDRRAIDALTDFSSN